MNTSLIGTTDLEFEGDANHVYVTEQETAYLIDVINDHFKLQLQQEDVISSFAGVRALYNDASAQASKVTRDYDWRCLLNLLRMKRHCYLFYGGKLTTYRKLAEAALLQLKRYFPHMKPRNGRLRQGNLQVRKVLVQLRFYVQS